MSYMNNHKFSNLTPSITAHFLKQVNAKGFDAQTIIRTWKAPMEVYPSRSHEGQWRITGNGVCIVGKPEGESFTFITIYEDRVLTAPRDDQTDAAGMRYRERWERGQGRG